MSHHGSERPFDSKPMSEMMKKLLGEFPDGKLTPHDEGATAVQVGQHGGRVVVEFPNPTKWIGFTPDQAVEIAATLIKHARAIGLTKPFTIEI